MSHNRCSCHLLSSSPKIPLGYHFKPTEAEVEYFLEKKKKNPEFSHQPIVTRDIYKVNPDELELASTYPAEGENMYFFTQLNLKNDGGSRVNRQAKGGFWVNKDAVRQGNSIGYKKSTFNFHEGEKSKGKKTDWLMKEYSLDEVEPPTMGTTTEACSRKGKRVAKTQDDNPKKMKEYVLCRIYKKSKAEKTNKPVITKEGASCFSTPGQPNIISNECPSATPGMQSYSQGGTQTGIALKDYNTPDQTNNITNENLLSITNENLLPTSGMYSEDDILFDFGGDYLDSWIRPHPNFEILLPTSGMYSEDDIFVGFEDITWDPQGFDHHLNFRLDRDLHQPRDGS